MRGSYTAHAAPAWCWLVRGRAAGQLVSSCRAYGESVDEPMWRQVNVKAKGKGMKTVIKADKHEMTLDEPKSVGGTDEGPSPFHAVLGALAGCEQATVHYLIKNKTCKLDIEKIYFDVEGSYDARGIMGIGNITPGFQKVKLIARLKTSASQAEIDALARKVQQHNPVAALFMSAGVPLEMEWKKLEKEE
ncbi:OsmC family protein [Acanthamoeba castellanii str. Neff]|uniref:OsmC family protein n=1 Tax=Acanthamoeba castellanii (strain ATCC 30010 / Neff) TaxID=1257118 RepID=L8GE22_ACACF|nr:OsmC family protein [Acanthamoeba castellanii str. Neff]ELR10973.1 OsmC family protein [Acanthamoeba castellanii str. Neff]